ncbi:MAG: PAS domain S-box protein [Mariniphaga sp.]
MMNDHNKSKEELLLELDALREELKSLRAQIESANFIENEGKRLDEPARSEALYKSILEASPDVITIADLQGNILLTSPRAGEMYGLSQTEDLKGLTVFDFLDEKDHPKAISMMTKMYEGPQGMVEYLAKRSDGTTFEVEVNSDFILDSSGKPVNMLIIIRDISQRKRIEEKLRKSEETYRNLVESVNDVIYEMTLDGTIIYLSPSAEKIIGYTAEELIGTNVFRIVYQEDIPGLLKRLSDNDEQQSRHFDLRFVSKDGDLCWVRSLPTNVIENGVIVGRKGILSDITQQKLAELELSENEKKYRSIFENIQDVYYEIAVDGTILEVSPSIELFSKGLYKRGDALGLSMFDFYTNKEDREHLHNELRKHGRITDFEIALKNRDGSILYCLYSAKLVFDQHGNPIKVIGSIHDISERKFAEQALKNSEASLNYAQEIAKMGSWEHNLITNKMTCSKNYCKVMGLCSWAGDDHLYDRFILTVLPEDLKLVKYLQETSYTEKKTEQVDIRIRMPDGSIRWIRNNVTPVFENGQLIALKGVNIDVTEQKLNEEKINHQNERLQAILEAIPDLIFVTARDGTYLEYYSSESDRLVVPDNQIIGRNIKELFNNETAALHIEKINECLEQQTIITYEFSGSASNKELFFEVRLAPLGNSRVLTVARDISDKRKNEEILRNSEEKYRYMFFNNPQPMWIYDLETLAFLEVNEAAIKHYGYSYEEFLSMTLKDIRPEEDIDNLLKDIKDKKWSLNRLGVWRHLKKNGELIYVELISHFVNFNGRNARHILLNDITERKQIEQEIRDLNSTLENKINERTAQLETTNKILLNEIEVREQVEQALSRSEKNYRTVVENVNEVIFQTDINGLWLFLNISWSRIMGYSVDESLGESFLNYVHPDDRQGNIDYFKPLINREKEFCHHEVRYLTKSGEIIWIEVFARLGLNENGEVTGTFGTLQDITIRKEAIEEIKKARMEAEQANMAKSEFLSRMSHELRTPMNSILGFAQLLQMGQLSTNQMKGVNHIVKSGKHLLDLINEVLDISRIEAGHLTLSLEPVLLSDAIKETIDILKPLCFDRQIKIEQTYSPDNKIYVNSDHQRLKQILLNLMNNAVKYNRLSGNIMIKAEKKLPEPNGTVKVRTSITDTGFGISADDIPKLFNPFERIGAEKSITEGTGLGLTVVKKLVDAMGGTIGVESEIGIGSTFWFELPYAENQLELINKNGRITDSDAVGNAKAGTILYIEDNSSNIELVEQILLNHRTGLHLISEMYGNSAERLVNLHKPDLILLDLDLPDVHGSVVLKRLKKNEITKDIPVVIVSADAMSHQLDRLMQLGAAYYLTKPLNVIEFLQIIDKFVVLKNNEPNNNRSLNQ